MSKPTGGLGSLLAFLFTPETQARAEADYARAQDDARKAHPGQAQEIANKAESEEQKEGEPKCWIN